MILAAGPFIDSQIPGDERNLKGFTWIVLLVFTSFLYQRFIEYHEMPDTILGLWRQAGPSIFRVDHLVWQADNIHMIWYRGADRDPYWKDGAIGVLAVRKAEVTHRTYRSVKAIRVMAGKLVSLGQSRLDKRTTGNEVWEKTGARTYRAS